MFKNKLVNMSIIILIGITLLGVVVVVLWNSTFATIEQPIEPKLISADEMVKLRVYTEEITTNLFTKDYIVVEFSILLNNIKAKEELAKRNPEVKSIIISTLSSLTPDDLKGEEGINRLEAALMNRFNEILHEGKAIRVLTTTFKIQ